MRSLKLSTARTIVVLMIDSTDHVTGKTGLTLAITASKNGAAFASISPTVVDLGTGKYSLALTSAHTDTLGDLALYITATGADPSDVVSQVVTDLPGVAQTGDNFARLGAPAGASVSADVAAVKAVLPAALDANGFIKADVEDWKGATAPAMTGDSFARLGAPAGASIAADIATRLATSGYTTPPTAAAVRTEIDSNSTQLAAIKAKTDVIVTGGATEANVTAVGVVATAVKSKTDNLPSDPADASDVAAAITAATSPLATAAALAVVATYVDTEVAAIKAKTDLIPASPAAVGSAMTLTSGERTSIAAAVWGALTSGLTVVGSIGKWLLDNIAALITSVGSGGSITLSQPVADDGTVTLYGGDDYLVVDGRAIDFVRDTDAPAWPDLTGATLIKLWIEGQPVALGSVLVATAPGQTVRFVFTKTETAAFAPGTRAYQLRATLADASVVTLGAGTFTVVAAIG